MEAENKIAEYEQHVRAHINITYARSPKRYKLCNRSTEGIPERKKKRRGCTMFGTASAYKPELP